MSTEATVNNRPAVACALCSHFSTRRTCSRWPGGREPLEDHTTCLENTALSQPEPSVLAEWTERKLPMVETLLLVQQICPLCRRGCSSARLKLGWWAGRTSCGADSCCPPPPPTWKGTWAYVTSSSPWGFQHAARAGLGAAGGWGITVRMGGWCICPQGLGTPACGNILRPPREPRHTGSPSHACPEGNGLIALPVSHRDSNTEC